MQKIDNLTSLRFIAAWAIVFYHMQSVILPIPSMPQFALGVSFFFVLSGFILSVVYRDLKPEGIPKFYLNRFARVWPVHIFMLFVVMFLFDPFALLSEFWRPVIALNSVLLHSWLPQPGYVFSMNPVSWSISTELAFYLAFPLIILSKRVGLVVLAMAVAICSTLLWIDSQGWPLTASSPWENSIEVFILQNPAVRGLEFAVGVLAGRIFVSRGPLKTSAITAIELLVAAGVVVFGMTVPLVSSWIKDAGSLTLSLWYGQSGGMIIFAAVIYVFASEGGLVSKVLKAKPLVILGEISFCTYMVHYPIILFCQKSGWMERASWEYVATMVVASTLVASWVVWYAVEKPARKLIVSLPGKFSRASSLDGLQAEKS